MADPNYIYDPEVENIDDIIHRNNPLGDYADEEVPQPSSIRQVKGSGSRKVFNTITKTELQEMEDDDAIIDFYLNNPDRFTLCEYFAKGHCRYGDNCKFMHPSKS